MGHDESNNNTSFIFELSKLAFEERVLHLINKPEFPSLEKLRFLSISQSNIEELFSIRIANACQYSKKKATNTFYSDQFYDAVRALKKQQNNFLRFARKSLPSNYYLPLSLEELICLNLSKDLKKLAKKILPNLLLKKLRPKKIKQYDWGNYYNFIIHTGNAEKIQVIQVSKLLPYFYRIHKDSRKYLIPLPIFLRANCASLFGQDSIGPYEIRVTLNNSIKPAAKKNHLAKYYYIYN